jgi:rhodanese-related sulfurtransferase
MRECTIADLAAAHAQGAAVVDVREAAEYVGGHVPGAALIPMGELGARLAEVPVDGTVFVICRSGHRSQSSSEFLERSGIDAVSVAGGTMGWIQAGHPVVTGLSAT